MQAPQFKENTGFCLLCREWKLLLVDGYQQGGKRAKKVSSYCIRCSQNLKKAADNARRVADTSALKSHKYPGHEARLEAHMKRIEKAGAA